MTFRNNIFSFKRSWITTSLPLTFSDLPMVLPTQTDTHIQNKQSKKNSISFLFVDINKISPMNRIEQMKMAISYKDEAAKSAQRHNDKKVEWVKVFELAHT